MVLCIIWRLSGVMVEAFMGEHYNEAWYIFSWIFQAAWMCTVHEGIIVDTVFYCSC